MKRYDPYTAPPPDEWNVMDEDERLTLIIRYHQRAGEQAPGQDLHDLINCLIENPIAMGDEIPIAKEFDRLMREGLDRHEALHAMGAVLAEHLHYLWNQVDPQVAGRDSDRLKSRYDQKVREWTAEKWRNMGQPEEDEEPIPPDPFSSV